MGLGVVFLIILVIVAIVAILILTRGFGAASRRNPNRAENEEEDRVGRER